MQARVPAVAASLAPACWLAGHLLAGSIPAAALEALAFVVPGGLLAWTWRRLPGPSSIARIGRYLLLVSALAFAAQGLFAFDPGDPESFARRMHVLAWTLWWVAFAPGALLQAIARGRASIAIAALAVALVCAPALLPLPRAALPWAQAGAELAWLAWWLAAARRAGLNRGAA